jgi:zinc D-Ala-D-Ala carboxypeptidase
MATVDHSTHFKRKELQCSFSGECQMQDWFMEKLEALRMDYNRPMRLSSAFRSIEHPRERTKPGGKGGRHTQGVAVDCLVYGEDALDLISLALKHGFNGIGVSQKGDFNSRFIHLDIRQESSPAIWSY